MFLLNLSTIRAASEHVERTYGAGAFAEGFAADEDVFSVVDPIELSFDVDKSGTDYRLAGRVKTTVELACSRCLEGFRCPVDEPFDLRYQPLVANAVVGDREVGDEDFSAAFYENDQIDLGQLIRERLYLTFPMKPLCREDCRGLCPQCGINLNRGTCDCRPAWDDPRLAPLKALQKKS